MISSIKYKLIKKIMTKSRKKSKIKFRTSKQKRRMTEYDRYIKKKHGKIIINDTAVAIQQRNYI